jgi:hypothetical protein
MDAKTVLTDGMVYAVPSPDSPLINLIPANDCRVTEDQLHVLRGDTCTAGAIEFDLVQPPSVDVNGDGIISPSDMIYVINRIGTEDLSADLDQDGAITESDVELVQQQLGSQIE